MYIVVVCVYYLFNPTGDSKAIKSALKSTSSGESDRQALKGTYLFICVH